MTTVNVAKLLVDLCDGQHELTNAVTTAIAPLLLEMNQRLEALEANARITPKIVKDPAKLPKLPIDTWARLEELEDQLEKSPATVKALVTCRPFFFLYLFNQ